MRIDVFQIDNIRLRENYLIPKVIVFVAAISIDNYFEISSFG